MVEWNEPPWTKEVGCPSIHLVRCMAPDLQIFRELVLNSYTTQSVKLYYSEAFEEIGNVYACTMNKRKYNDGEL